MAKTFSSDGFFDDYANNLSTKFSYYFVGTDDDIAETLEPSEGDFEIMVKQAGRGYNSGEMEYIANDESSHRLAWSISEQYQIDDDDDEDDES